MNTRQSSRLHSRGITLVESLVAMATLAVTVASTLPGFEEVCTRRRLEGTAAQLTADIHQARSLALSQGTPVRLAVQQVSGGACYVIHTGHAGDCVCTVQGGTQCRAGASALRTAGLASQQAIRLSSNSASMLFDGRHGTVTPTGSLTMTAADGRALRVVVNIMGRARTCSPGAAVRGYTAC